MVQLGISILPLLIEKERGQQPFCVSDRMVESISFSLSSWSLSFPLYVLQLARSLVHDAVRVADRETRIAKIETRPRERERERHTWHAEEARKGEVRRAGIRTRTSAWIAVASARETLRGEWIQTEHRVMEEAAEQPGILATRALSCLYIRLSSIRRFFISSAPFSRLLGEILDEELSQERRRPVYAHVHYRVPPSCSPSLALFLPLFLVLFPSFFRWFHLRATSYSASLP